VYPDEIAAEAAAESLADVLALQGASAEFLADEKAVAVSSVETEDDYFLVAPVAVLVDDCSPAVCPGIAEAAARAEPQMADGEHCDCWAQERCDCPVRRDDRCLREHCDFREEQAGYQGRLAEEHCHWDDRGRYCSAHHYWVAHYSVRHCPDHQGAARSDFRERRGVRCCWAGLGDSPAVQDVGPLHCYRDDCSDGCRVDYLAVRLAARSAVRDVALPRDCQERSVDPDDSLPHLAVRDGWVGRSAGLDGSPRRLAGLDDWVVRSAGLDARREQQDSGHHVRRVARVEPEQAVPHGLFSQEAGSDERLRLERLADYPDGYRPLAAGSRPPDD
jgi:hypothetical protein